MVIAWLLASFVAGLTTTWVVRALSQQLRLVDYPKASAPQHRSPVPNTGGVAIAITVAMATLFAQVAAAQDAPLIPVRVWIPAGLFLIVGVIDDLRPLHAVLKVTLQFAAAIAAVLLGLEWHVTGSSMLDHVITVLWFVLLVNAFNMTDVCDGLVAGITVLVLAFAGTQTPQPWLALVTIGATLGFLVFNRPPASIFLGDGGSHMLGFIVGAMLLSIVPAGAEPSWKYAAAVVVPCGVFALRLPARGLSRLTTDLVAWSVTALLCAIAWSVLRWGP